MVVSNSIIGCGRFQVRGARRAARRRGFTLAECLIACVVLSLAVASVSSAIVAGQTDAAYAIRAERAVRLAEDMMARIQSRPYTDVATYNNRTETPSNLKDLAGALYPSDYQAYTRKVTTATTTQTVANLGGSIAGTNVTVAVSDTQGLAISMTRFIPGP